MTMKPLQNGNKDLLFCFFPVFFFFVFETCEMEKRRKGRTKRTKESKDRDNETEKKSEKGKKEENKRKGHRNNFCFYFSSSKPFFLGKNTVFIKFKKGQKLIENQSKLKEMNQIYFMI